MDINRSRGLDIGRMRTCLPFGHLKTWQTNTYTKFKQDEQRIVMTLWSIAGSPLIMGGNMPDNDDFILSLMNNNEVIAVNQASENNHQLFNVSNYVAWAAKWHKLRSGLPR